MATQNEKEPLQAWITTFAGVAVNLCLGILYAWSMWSAALTNVDKAGQPMSGLNQGWTYLTNAQAATPFSLCMIMFALLMIPGGRIQDKISPKFGATLGGLFLASGCIIAGLMKSYLGLIIGFGICGGIGMGIGYAAPTPAALKWFGPHRRGLIAGLVVGGYGGAALYISPLAKYLIDNYGISKSFIFLGIFFATVVTIAGQLLKTPNEVYPDAYVPPAPPCPRSSKIAGAATLHDWSAKEMLRSWQFYALVFMFILTTQSGMLMIANAAGILKTAGAKIPFFADNIWLIVAYGGLVNALGRVGTGIYSDKIGRANTYTMNCLVSAVCLLFVPYAIHTQNILLLFLVVGNAYWQYGGGLALMPLFTGDFYGAKNLGINYGLVFLGWGLGFFMAKLGGTIKDLTGSLDYAFYISAALLVVGAVLVQLVKRPTWAEDKAKAAP